MPIMMSVSWFFIQVVMLFQIIKPLFVIQNIEHLQRNLNTINHLHVKPLSIKSPYHLIHNTHPQTRYIQKQSSSRIKEIFTLFQKRYHKSQPLIRIVFDTIWPWNIGRIAHHHIKLVLFYNIQTTAKHKTRVSVYPIICIIKLFRLRIDIVVG